MDSPRPGSMERNSYAFKSQMHKEFYQTTVAFLRDSSIRVGILAGGGSLLVR